MKRLQVHGMNGRFALQPFIAADGVRAAGYGDQRGQEVVAVRSPVSLPARVAQFAQGQARRDARPQVGGGVLGAFD